MYLFLFGAGTGQAQPCDPTLRPTTDALRYEPRGNRCEGFYESRVATASIDLAGALIGHFYFTLDPAETIEITSPLVDDRSLSLRGQTFAVKTYYRMDAELSPGGRFEWPVRDVLLDGEGLTAERISVAGSYDTGTGKVFVPMRAVARLGTAAQDSLIRLYFRATTNLRNVRARIVDASGEYRRWQPLRGGRSGRPIVVVLPTDLDGVIEVIVQGEARADGSLIDRRVRVNVGSR